MKLIPVLAVAGLLGVLGGCASPSDESTASSSPDQAVATSQDDAAVTSSPPEEETAAPTDDDATGDATTSDDAESPDATGDDASSGGSAGGSGGGGSDSSDPACLHGRWVADNDFFLAAVQEFSAEVTSVSGAVVLEFFADGTMETDYQEWTVTGVSSGQEVQLSRVGLDTSTYTATGATLTLVDDYVGSMLALSMGEQVMVLEPRPISYTDVAYTCSASGVNITTPDGELELAPE